MSSFADKRVVIFSLLLAAVTLAFYNPVSHNAFTDFDDSVYILRNTQIQTGLTLDTLKWSFTSFRAGYWHPVTWLSHALDCQIFHLNPAGHHYVNLLLHVASAVLLFLLLFEATGYLWPSLFVSAVFALHPINVESVAWIAERKNVLSMLFFILALRAYDRYARTGRRDLYYWVAAYFALGLMAKPQVVTLPFVLLLWDYWPLNRLWPAERDGTVPPQVQQQSFSFLALEKLPLFILAAAESVITVIAQRAGGAVRTAGEVSLPARVENAIVSYARYLGKIFVPRHLAPMYPHPLDTLPVWQVAAASVLLIAITGWVLLQRQQRYLAVGWFWFLGTLVPMIGLVTVGEQAMADRFAYIPIVGLLIAVTWGMRDFVAQRQLSPVIVGVAMLLVTLTLGAVAHHQLGYWHDDETLWRYTLSTTERNYMAHDNLAIALAKQGRSDEAVQEFRTAMSLHRYPPAQVLALALYEQRVGHIQEAMQDCDSVLHSAAEPKAQAIAWSEKGLMQLQLRSYDQATASYRNALRLNPEDGTALVGSGVLAMRDGQSDLAVAQLTHAMKVDPSDVNMLLLEQALRRAGHSSEADSAAAEVRRVSSDPGQAQSAAGQMLSMVGLKPL